MAHSPEKKAQAVAEFIAGDGWDAVSERHGISKSTLKRWLADASATLIRGPESDPRIEQKSNSAESQNGEIEQKSNSSPGNHPMASDPSTLRIEQLTGRFQLALVEFLLASVEMGTAIAKTCSDPKFLRDKPGGANELVRTVLERADSMVAYLKVANESGESQSGSK